MMEIKRISAKMIPAVESISERPMVGDISSVPAVRVELKYGNQTLNSIGIIDTGADLCVLDEHVFKLFTEVQTESIAVMATGFSRQKVMLVHLSLRIIGDDPEQAIEVENVPVAITKLDRQMLIIGRRGMLERLKVELDFPRNQLNLFLSHPTTNKYPALAHEFPSLDSAIKSFEEDRYVEAIMAVAWAMERFLDSIIIENPDWLKSIDKSRPPRTLREKLLFICQAKNITDLTAEIQEFLITRNAAAHGELSKIDRMSTEKMLKATENIVSRLMVAKVTT